MPETTPDWNSLPETVLEDIKFEDTPNEPTTPVVPETPAESIEQAEAPVATPEPEVTEKKRTPPTRHDGETETQFNLRVQIYQAGQAKAEAKTEEEKSFLSRELNKLRSGLAKASTQPKASTPIATPEPTVPAVDPTVAEKEEAIKVLKDLGFIPQEDVNSLVQEKISALKEESDKQQRITEQTSAVNSFYEHRQDIFTDDSKREAFEQYVWDKFGAIIPNLSKNEFAEILDMSASYIFPRENVNKKINQTQQKVNALNIYGSQAAEVVVIDSKTKESLKSMGWGDDQINSFGP